MNILLIIVLVLFVGVNVMVLAFCRSAALADQKLESLRVRRAIDFSNAITRPTPKRVSSESCAENSNGALRQSGFLP